MTVSTEVDHNEYMGNGVTTSFPYTFRIFKKSDLVVQVVDLSENITELTLDTDYTVTGAGGYTGGNVVLSSPLANGYQISISRELPVTQETDLRNQGKFFAEVHEDAFDKLTMLIQQAFSWLRLALRKPSFVANYYDALNNYIRNLRDPLQPQDAATKNYVDSLSNTNLSRTLRTPEPIISLPDIDQRKNKIVAMDDSGNPLMVLPESGSAADVLIELAKPYGYTYIGGLAEHYGPKRRAVFVDRAPYNGDFKTAYDAAVAEGIGNISFFFGNGTYNCTTVFSSGRNTLPGISLIGSGRGTYASDYSKFVDGTGTILQGAIKNQTRGFNVEYLSVDCGNYVSQNLYGATPVYEDAIQIYGVVSASDASILRNANNRIFNVSTLNSLGISSNPGTHSILIEHISGVELGYVKCVGGYHGLTLKCQRLIGGNVECFGQYGDSMIIRSDSETTVQDISLDTVYLGTADTTGLPNGGLTLGGILDASGANIDGVRIGKLVCTNTSWGLLPSGTGFFSRISIDQYEATQVFGNYFSLTVPDKAVGWTIGQHMCSGVSGGIKVTNGSSYITLGDGSVTGSSTHGYSLAGDTLSHGSLISNGNAGYGVEHVSGLGFNPALVIAYNNTLGNFSGIPSVVAAAPLNNWSQGADFKATSVGHMVHVSGSFIRGATSGQQMVQFLSTAQPPQQITLMAWSSDTGVIANVFVDTAGYLNCANFGTIAPGATVHILGSYLKK